MLTKNAICTSVGVSANIGLANLPDSDAIQDLMFRRESRTQDLGTSVLEELSGFGNVGAPGDGRMPSISGARR